MPFLEPVLGGSVALSRESLMVEVMKVRENPCQSIRISMTKGAYIYSPKLRLQISGSGNLHSYILPWKVTQCHLILIQ